MFLNCVLASGPYVELRSIHSHDGKRGWCLISYRQQLRSFCCLWLLGQFPVVKATYDSPQSRGAGINLNKLCDHFSVFTVDVSTNELATGLKLGDLSQSPSACVKRNGVRVFANLLRATGVKHLCRVFLAYLGP